MGVDTIRRGSLFAETVKRGSSQGKWNFEWIFDLGRAKHERVHQRRAISHDGNCRRIRWITAGDRNINTRRAMQLAHAYEQSSKDPSSVDLQACPDALSDCHQSAYNSLVR